MRETFDEYTEVTKETKKGRKLAKKAVALSLSAVMLGGIAGASFQGASYATSKLAGAIGTTLQTTNADIAGVGLVSTGSSTITSDVSKIVEETMPSIVSITNMGVREVQNFFGQISKQESQSCGSGIIIGKTDAELLMLSNNHVVEGAKTLSVTFCNEDTVEAKIKGTDSSRDLAVVAVNLSDISQETMNAIKIISIGDSDAMEIGQPVIAIGNALGYGQSVTTGIVSALHRQMDEFKGEYIQTDAAINPGNSGGALLNINGQLIGINSAKIANGSVEGMGFAIPISDVKDIIENLMNKTTREIVDEEHRGYLGISGYTVDEASAERYGMYVGVYVAEAEVSGPAAIAGIGKGDIITTFDGQSVDSIDSLCNMLTYYKAGEKVEVKVMVPGEKGEYQEKQVTVKLGAKTES